MTAISLKQPWAQLILDGVKTIETRKWRTNYRGDLLKSISLKNCKAQKELADWAIGAMVVGGNSRKTPANVQQPYPRR